MACLHQTLIDDVAATDLEEKKSLGVPLSLREMEADATSSPTYLLAPKSFLKDRWEALKKIGGGGFGEIYKAKDHLTNTVRQHFLFFVPEKKQPLLDLKLDNSL